MAGSEFDRDKVDEMTLALMYLVIHDRDKYGARVWKGFDWDTMDRLHEKGYISDPARKAKSVVMSPEACAKSQELFRALREVSGREGTPFDLAQGPEVGTWHGPRV